MHKAALIILLLGVGCVYCGPVASNSDDASNADSGSSSDSDAAPASDSAAMAADAPATTSATLNGQPLPAGADAIPVPASSSDSGNGDSSLPHNDGIADYLSQIRRPALRMTIDSVNEGYKKKNRNSFEDANIKIHNRNSSDFSRNGQVQSFEGPGFKMRTAVITENNNGRVKSAVVTAQDSEKNYTRSRDRLTQFVGTLDTDQFSSGALLTDHANRAVIGSVRLQSDGNREQRLQKKTNDDLVRGSFLKTANLTINARYQSNAFSDRQRLISDIVLGGAGGSDGGEESSGAAGASAPAVSTSPGQGAAADDGQDDS